MESFFRWFFSCCTSAKHVDGKENEILFSKGNEVVHRVNSKPDKKSSDKTPPSDPIENLPEFVEENEIPPSHISGKLVVENEGKESTEIIRQIIEKDNRPVGKGLESELVPIPEEPPFRESSSVAAGKEETKKAQPEDDSKHKKETLKTHPEKDDQIAVKIHKKSNFLIKGRSSEVIRVANLLRNAI